MKVHYCFLERFNNYFNRKIIKYDDIEDYIAHSKNWFMPITTNPDGTYSETYFDFNPNDNITTEIIANDVPFEPDYILIFDKDDNILSRWFIMEQKRNRNGQWSYQLRRDVISDHLDSLLTAPIFVEKGMLNEDDPFIVNNEGMSLNQVKVQETALLDESNTAWIVGYMARNVGGTDINIQVASENVTFDYITLSDIASSLGVSEATLIGLLNFNGDETIKTKFTDRINFDIGIYESGSGSVKRTFKFTHLFNSGTYGDDLYYAGEVNHLFAGSMNLSKPFVDAVIDKKTLWKSQLGSMFSRSYYLDASQLTVLRTFVGKIIKYNGKYYNFALSDKGNISEEITTIRNDGTYSAITQTAQKAVELSNGQWQAGTYDPAKPKANVITKIKLYDYTVCVKLDLVADDVIPRLTTKISSGRNITGDQEFDIFAIPLNISIYDENYGDSYNAREIYARRIASAIGLETDAKVYDIQLLPYCPIPSLISGTGEINISSLTEHTDYDFITKNASETAGVAANKGMITFTQLDTNEWQGDVTLPMIVPVGETGVVEEILGFANHGTVESISYTISGDNVIITFGYIGEDPALATTTINISLSYHTTEETVCGIMLYVQSATFENVIETQITSDLSKKVVSNCKMWRLVSPNYQGAFEFNIAKNGGRVAYFNIFCTYKPYTPLIKVAPNFEWLYGQEFQDNRGLICGGDYSLPRVSDAWISYQLNNKNYQNIFNREIEHLDFMQSLEMRNQLVSGAVGILSDATKGAGAGAMVGGGWGALAGAVIGAGTSAIGYGIDVDTLARQHRENKQLAIDKFNYQLGNVKALPYTLTKVGSFDAISKIFPFVEEYSCTQEELEAFENKIKYESMTVMRIGNLEQFKDFDEELHYFKGSLIRNDEIADDPHTLNAIYEELMKGVYI